MPTVASIGFLVRIVSVELSSQMGLVGVKLGTRAQQIYQGGTEREGGGRGRKRGREGRKERHTKSERVVRVDRRRDGRSISSTERRRSPGGGILSNREKFAFLCS